MLYISTSQSSLFLSTGESTSVVQEKLTFENLSCENNFSENCVVTLEADIEFLACVTESQTTMLIHCEQARKLELSFVLVLGSEVLCWVLNSPFLYYFLSGLISGHIISPISPPHSV